MDNKTKCGCICAVAVIVIGIITIAFCAATVEPIQYGLKYNTLSKNIDATEVYEGGWYIIGPLNKFIQFPRTQVNVDFANLTGSKQKPIGVRSGVPVTMSFSFQYKLIKKSLPKMYQVYNINYEKNLLAQVEGVIKQEATQYNMTDYWTKRKEVGDKFCAALNTKLEYANCTGFQLLTIELLPTNEAPIVKTEVSKQQQFQKQYEQDAAFVTNKMSVDTSLAQQQMTIQNGEALAEATRLVNQAQGNATRITIDSQSSAYTIASKLTGLTANDQLMDYIYYTNLLSGKNSTILVGVDKAVINMQSGKGY